MITASKSPNFHNQPWLPCIRKRSISETHSSILQWNRNPSDYFLRIILNRVHKLQSSSGKLKYLSLSLSPPSPLFVGWTILKPEQFNCIIWTRTKAQNNTHILPYSPMPLKVAQVGNLEKIICNLNEVTCRIHQIRLPPNNSLNKTGVIEATVPFSKPFPNDNLNKIGRCWSYTFQSPFLYHP